MSKYRRRYPPPQDQVEFAIDQHRRAIDIVRQRHLERRRLARLLWNVEDEATINVCANKWYRNSGCVPTLQPQSRTSAHL